MPFIEEILNGINTIICDLQPQQVWPINNWLLFCIYRFLEDVPEIIVTRGGGGGALKLIFLGCGIFYFLKTATRDE
jgi:hypothetical protein